MSVDPDTLEALTSLPPQAKRRAPWIFYARIGWVALFVISLGLFVASIPVHYDRILASSTRWSSTAESLSQLGISISVYAVYMLILTTLSVIVFVGVGVLIFWAKPDDPMALFCSFVLVAFGVVWPNMLPSLEEYVQLYPVLGILINTVDTLGFGLFFWLFYLFPSGTFVPRWTRPIAILFLLMIMYIDFFPGTPLDMNTWQPPLNLGLGMGIFATMLYAQVYRYRRVSDAIQRQQTKWVVYSLVMGIIGFTLISLASSIPPFNAGGKSEAVYALSADVLFSLVFLLIPIAIGFAVLRYRLWDIDLLVNRTLVYGILTISVVGLYVLIVGYFSAVFQTSANLFISLLATGVVAVIFHPLRERLQRGVNRLMYGQRDEPYTVISQLGEQLETAPAPDDVLVTLVETLAKALKLPYAAIEFTTSDDRTPGFTFYPPSAAGNPPVEVLRIPLIYQSESIGNLLVAPRSPNEPFGQAELRLLKTIAIQVGAAVHAIQLTVDLRHSRERLVTTREEERRRIRRDLHDGLGPVLASLAIQADEARELARKDPAKTEALLAEVTRQAQVAISDIRRLVYGLRPPSLDELGLAGALRAQAENLQTSLDVTVDIPEILPPLPAAIEVAVFRITQEALTNIMRHARASRCEVRLALDGKLHLEISDDGIGRPGLHNAGLGLNSMRERAEELGGTFVIEAKPGGGTRVVVQLPLMADNTV